MASSSSLRCDISELHASTTLLLERVATLGVTLVEGPSCGQVSDTLHRHLDEFRSKQRSLTRRHRDQNFTVAILAQAKSGKSTFINAVVGASLLPSNNVPETACLVRLRHNPEILQPALHAAADVVGESAIRRHLTALNVKARGRRGSRAADEEVLELEVAMAALQGAASSMQDSVSFSLLDTPGPNEAGEEKLKHAVERLLDGVDAVIYVLDYTKLKTSSEAAVFEQLKSINPQLLRRLSERLHFVVNKADMKHVCEGMDSECTQEYVASLLNSQMQLESFQMQPSQVLLISARDAFLARMVLRDQPMEDSDMSKFKTIAFGCSSRRKKRSSQDIQQAAEEMLEESGVPDLEARVLGHLTANASSIKLTAVLDDLTRLLHLVGNGVAAGTAALETDKEALQAEIDGMQEKLRVTLSGFDDAKQDCEAIETEIVDEVRSRLHFLKEKLAAKIAETLDEAATDPPPNGRWRSVWEMARGLVGRQQLTEEDSLQQKLAALHSAIFASIDDEVRDFWHQLEVSTNGRQAVLLRRLNQRLAELTVEIEATVSEALAVELQPIAISLTPPSAQDFHNSLATLFAHGVGTRTVVKHREREVTNTSWEQRYSNGLCRTGVYFVGVPTTETVTEEYEETVFEVEPEKVRSLLTHLVGEVIDKSIHATRSFVRQYLADTIARGHEGISQYALRYTDTMIAALATCMQGEDARQAALEASHAQSTAVQELLSEAAALQRRTCKLHAACPLPGATFADAVDVERPTNLSASDFNFFDASSVSGSVANLPDAIADAEAAEIGSEAHSLRALQHDTKSGLTADGALLAQPACDGAPPSTVEIEVQVGAAAAAAPSDAAAWEAAPVQCAPAALAEPLTSEPALGAMAAAGPVSTEEKKGKQPPVIQAHAEDVEERDEEVEHEGSESPASRKSLSGGEEWLVVGAEQEEGNVAQAAGQASMLEPVLAHLERMRRQLSDLQ